MEDFGLVERAVVFCSIRAIQMAIIIIIIIIEKKKNIAIYLLAVSSLVLKLGLHIVVGSSRLDNHS